MLSMFERVVVETVGGGTSKSHQTSVITKDGETSVQLDPPSPDMQAMYVLRTTFVRKFPGYQILSN